MELREYMNAYIAENGISQRELARQCGVSPQTITNILKGIKSPDTDTLAKLVNGMKCYEARIATVNGKTYIRFPDEKEDPATGSDRVSDKDKQLIEWFRSLPPEKQKAILIAQDAPSELL